MRAASLVLSCLVLHGCGDGLAAFKDGGTPPEISILIPDDGAVFTQGTGISFAAVVSDNESRAENLAIRWTSSLDPIEGDEPPDASGVTTWDPAELSAGEHLISATATDPQGFSGTAYVTITVDPDGTLVTDTDQPTVDTPPDPVDTDPPAPVDTEPPAPVDTDPPAPVDTDPPAPVDTDPPVDTDSPTTPAMRDCYAPIIFERKVHSQGSVDFRDIAWSPDGEYALILGYSSKLYRWDPSTETLTSVADGGDEFWYTVRFSADGTYALVGGGSTTSNPNPRLYVYTEAAGLEPIPDIVGTGSGKLLSTYRVQALSADPVTGRFAVFGDNAASWPSQIGCFNMFEPDFSTGIHTWAYEGCVSIDQGASSIDWGTNLGQPIALGTSRYLELVYFDPNLPGNRFSEATTPSTGNLKRALFNPANRSVAWVLNWSGSGRVYTWEGVLRNDPSNSYGFTGYSMWDFAVSSDGVWKLFVGRAGNAYLSDSPWRPLDHDRFYQTPIPSFDQPPWSGTSNDYLHAVAWRPNTCEGLIVGDATQGQGLIAYFSLQ